MSLSHSFILSTEFQASCVCPTLLSSTVDSMPHMSLFHPYTVFLNPIFQTFSRFHLIQTGHIFHYLSPLSKKLTLKLLYFSLSSHPLFILNTGHQYLCFVHTHPCIPQNGFHISLSFTRNSRLVQISVSETTLFCFSTEYFEVILL